MRWFESGCAFALLAQGKSVGLGSKSVELSVKSTGVFHPAYPYLCGRSFEVNSQSKDSLARGFVVCAFTYSFVQV